MPEILAATAGESLLASEVAAPMFAADASFVPAAGALGELGPMAGMGALGGVGGLLGGGASFAGTGLGAGGLQGGLGSITAAVAPEATAQVQSALQAAQPGANQIATQAMPEATQRWLESSTAGYGNAGTSDVINRIAQGSGDEIARLGEAQTSAPTMADAIDQQRIADAYKTAQEVGMQQQTGSGGLMDALKSMGSKVGDWWDKQPTEKKLLYGGAGLLGAQSLFGSKPGGVPTPTPYSGPLSKFKYDPAYYTPTIPAQPVPYTPMYRDYRSYADGGTVMDGGSPGTQLQGANDPLMFQSTGVERMAGGGIASLGNYSDGGQMLKGPGDGMSDSIPATIAGKQPARLANDEFVVPADVVSHLGNGSSDAGAKQLYKMMYKVRQARTGKKAQGKQIDPSKYLPT